jgi:tRNA (cytidine/uridine-2'-O-)-methyltransferase
MLHIVLFQPDIPQNTGNIGRLCAFTDTRLHLIHPLGFEITEKRLRRAGMDYWQHLDVHEHESWEAFKASDAGPKRLWLFTTHAEKAHWDIEYEDGDGLLFGKETAGAPQWLHDEVGDEQRVTIPRYQSFLRSLNLATSAGIATYEALRQLQGTVAQGPNPA